MTDVCEATGEQHVVEAAEAQDTEAQDTEAQDAEAVADVLASAFADYAWTNWIVQEPGRLERLRGLHLLTTERVGLPYGEVVVARCPTPDGGICGAAVALRPDRAVPQGVWREMAPLENELMGARATAAQVAEEQVAPLRPAGPLLVVATIGIRPDHWRRGIASRLLRPVLAVADDLGVPAYLETSSAGNVALYERAGFRTVGTTQIHGDGPFVCAMVRRPTQWPAAR